MLRTFLTAFTVPFLALGAEMSTDYYDRSRLASSRTNIGWFVGILVPTLCLAFLFQDQDGLDGRFVLEHYQSYDLVSAITVLIASAICIGSTGI